MPQPDARQPDGMLPEFSNGLFKALLQNPFVVLILFFFPKPAIRLAVGPGSPAQSQPSPDLS